MANNRPGTEQEGIAMSLLDILNRALDKLGQKPLVNTAEPGPNAARVRRMWPACRDAVLREHPWKCATKRVQLNELKEKPLFGFSHRYQLPSDFLRLVAVEPQGASVEVEGNTLLADVRGLAIAYVSRVENPRLYDAALSEALSLKLASELAYGTTGSSSLAEQLRAEYQQKLKEARGHDAREGSGQTRSMGTWSRAKLGG